LAKRNVPIYVHPKELDYLDKGAPRGLFLDLPRDQVKPVKSGDKLTMGNTSITFLHTPGHTPGSQCFLVNEQLLSGDTLFLGTCGRCDLPGSNPSDMFDSLNRVIGQLPSTTTLYPGHNYSAKHTQGTLADERKANRFLTAHRLEDFLRLVGY
jgi:hydroxyacylglutathione hydrolase